MSPSVFVRSGNIHDLAALLKTRFKFRHIFWGLFQCAWLYDRRFSRSRSRQTSARVSYSAASLTVEVRNSINARDAIKIIICLVFCWISWPPSCLLTDCLHENRSVYVVVRRFILHLVWIYKRTHVCSVYLFVDFTQLLKCKMRLFIYYLTLQVTQ